MADLQVLATFKYDFKETKRDLTEIERQTFPTAYAKSLTFIAQDAAEAVRERTRSEYKLHTEFIPKGIGVKPARDSDMKATGNASSVVFTKPKISKWMPIHETGGTVTPIGGRKQFSLPGKDMLAEIDFRTRSGKVKKRYSPKRLLEGYNASKGQSGGNSKALRRQPFVIRGTNSGVPMIVRRRGKKRYPLQVMYVFRARTRYRQTWRFEPTVRHMVEQRFQSVFERVWIAEQRKAIR